MTGCVFDVGSRCLARISYVLSKGVVIAQAGKDRGGGEKVWRDRLRL